MLERHNYVKGYYDLPSYLNGAMQIELLGLDFAKKMNALCMSNRKGEQIPQHTRSYVIHTGIAI